MKKHLLLAMLCVAGTAHASVLLELAGGYLKTSSGEKAPGGSGLLVLVASTKDDAFAAPTTDTILSAGKTVTAGSDDVILLVTPLSGDGNSNGSDDAGEFRKSLNLELGDDVPAGSPLRLYWFPTLSTAATSPLAATAYGAYRADAGDADGSDAWVLPADGTTGRTLLFLTSDAGSSVNSVTSGSAYGMPDLAVTAGNGSTLSAVDLATDTSTQVTATSGTATSITNSAISRKLAALRTQLRNAEHIHNPERRKKRIAALRARIQTLLAAQKSSN